MRREQSGVICLYSGRGGDGASPFASQTTRGEGECLTLGEKLKGLLLGKGVDHDAFTLEHYFQMNVRNFLKQLDSSIISFQTIHCTGKSQTGCEHSKSLPCSAERVSQRFCFMHRQEGGQQALIPNDQKRLPDTGPAPCFSTGFQQPQ